MEIRLPVHVSDDFLMCPNCDSTDMYLDTTTIIDNGIILGKSGVEAHLYCRDCDKTAALHLCNDDAGVSIKAFISWKGRI